MSDHVAGKAGFLAALPDNDPERRAADEHARTCASCLEALGEGDRLIRLLAEAMPMSPPTPEAMARTAVAIKLEAVGQRRAQVLLPWVMSAGVAAAWGAQLVLVPKLALGAGRMVVSFAVLLAAIASLLFLRIRARFAVAAIIGISALFAFTAGNVPLLAPKIGVECALFEVGLAAIPWLLALAFARIRGIDLSRWAKMTAAAGGALASQAAQHLACPVPYAHAHLIVFHLGGVVLATVLGGIGPVG